MLSSSLLSTLTSNPLFIVESVVRLASPRDICSWESLSVPPPSSKARPRAVCDLVVEDCLVEIKAKKELEDVDFVQILSYLKAYEFKVALLVNFGGKRVQVRRLLH